MRKVRTASGAVAVQVARKNRGRVEIIEHVGSAHTDAELGVLVTPAESARFAAPLLLVHGLWSGAWIWGRMASYLAHRGWESWAIDRLDGPEAAGLAAAGADVVGRCQGVARAMPAPPVLVAHDAGAAVALRIAAALGSPAVAVINPVLPGRAARRLALSLPGLIGLLCWRAIMSGGRLCPAAK